MISSFSLWGFLGQNSDADSQRRDEGKHSRVFLCLLNISILFMFVMKHLLINFESNIKNLCFLKKYCKTSVPFAIFCSQWARMTEGFLSLDTDGVPWTLLFSSSCENCDYRIQLVNQFIHASIHMYTVCPVCQGGQEQKAVSWSDIYSPESLRPLKE